ncbi:hypothetical protein BK054_15595 [Myroides sp. ZB35]|nr:hypothetical protein BK054_15595 [Myroides sp. ZB35]
MFSVIIPLYNKQESIQNTIQSVLNQTEQDFEIIVVNDGSKDQSIEKVQEFKDPRIRIINKPNGGVSSARNRGIDEANYCWIAFLDGDDLWQKNHLREVKGMMDHFSNEKVYVTSFEYSDKREFFKHSRETNIFKIENYFKEAMREPLIWTSIAVVHKSCFIDVGNFNEKLSRGEDLDVWARLASKNNIIKSSKVTATYRVDAENKISIGKSEYHKSLLSVIDLSGLEGDKRRYFKNIVVRRLKVDLKTFDLKELLFLLMKHNLELLK